MTINQRLRKLIGWNALKHVGSRLFDRMVRGPRDQKRNVNSNSEQNRGSELEDNTRKRGRDTRSLTNLQEEYLHPNTILYVKFQGSSRMKSNFKNSTIHYSLLRGMCLLLIVHDRRYKTNARSELKNRVEKLSEMKNFDENRKT